MNIRRVLSTTAAGAAIVLGVTACGGASDTSKNWFAAWCEGIQSLQDSAQGATGADALTTMQTQMADLAANLKSLPAPDVDGGQDFANSQVALFEAASDPNADSSTMAGLTDFSEFENNSGLEEAVKATPQCEFLQQ